jgi:hypothetical protein
LPYTLTFKPISSDRTRTNWFKKREPANAGRVEKVPSHPNLQSKVQSSSYPKTHKLLSLAGLVAQVRSANTRSHPELGREMLQRQ